MVRLLVWTAILLVSAGLAQASDIPWYTVEVTTNDGSVRTIDLETFLHKQENLPAELSKHSPVGEDGFVELNGTVGLGEYELNAPILLMNDYIFFLPHMAKETVINISGNQAEVTNGTESITAKFVPFVINGINSAQIRSIKVIDSLIEPEPIDSSAGTISIYPNDQTFSIVRFDYWDYVEGAGIPWYSSFCYQFGSTHTLLDSNKGLYRYRLTFEEIESITIDAHYYVIEAINNQTIQNEIEKPIPVFPIIGYTVSGAYYIYDLGNTAIVYKPDHTIPTNWQFNIENATGVTAQVTNREDQLCQFREISTTNYNDFLCDNHQRGMGEIPPILYHFLAFQKNSDTTNSWSEERYYLISQVKKVIKLANGKINVETIDGQTEVFDDIICNHPSMYGRVISSYIIGISDNRSQMQPVALSYDDIKAIEFTAEEATRQSHQDRMRAEANKWNLPDCTVVNKQGDRLETNGAFIADGGGWYGGYLCNQVGVKDIYFWMVGPEYSADDDIKMKQLEISQIAALEFDLEHQHSYSDCPIVKIKLRDGTTLEWTLVLRTESYGGVWNYGFWPYTDRLIGVLPDSLIAWPLSEVREIVYHW